MDAQTQLLSLIIGSMSFAALETVVLLITRRDVKLGLKKFFLKKLGKRPIKIRLYGPDGTVKEHIVGTKGKEQVKIEDGVYMIRSKAIRKGDDDVNELSYSYKNVLPFKPEAPAQTIEAPELSPAEEAALKKLQERTPLSKAEIEVIAKLNATAGMDKKEGFKLRFGKEKPEVEATKQYEPLDQDEAESGTNPTLLDKFVEYVYLVAKAEALKKLGNVDFWIKAGAIAAFVAALAGIAAWYAQGNDVLPALQSLSLQVNQCYEVMRPAAQAVTNSSAVITV